jgi:hypothetical protein
VECVDVVEMRTYKIGILKASMAEVGPFKSRAPEVCSFQDRFFHDAPLTVCIGLREMPHQGEPGRQSSDGSHPLTFIK